MVPDVPRYGTEGLGVPKSGQDAIVVRPRVRPLFGAYQRQHLVGERDVLLNQTRDLRELPLDGDKCRSRPDCGEDTYSARRACGEPPHLSDELAIFREGTE